MSLLSLILISALSHEVAQASNKYECLRELVPVTDRAFLRHRRKQVEAPFFLNNGRFMVFPEVDERKVTGFFVYNASGAWYFDSIKKSDGTLKAIADLLPGPDGIYELIAQPSGLETVAIHLLPGFSKQKGNKDGPVMLGASVLPVVGAFVSRPDLQVTKYTDPVSSSEQEIKGWMLATGAGRSPASANEQKMNRTLVHLKTQKPKSSSRLWEPLEEEFHLRRDWIKRSNLDEQSFRQLTRIMSTTCNG